MKRLTKYVLFLVVVLFAGAAGAQIDRTEINGTVTDPSGAAVPGVTVTVTQSGTNQMRSVTTDGHGQFVVSSLPIGRFSVVFGHDGFKDTRVADLDLHSGDVRTLNTKLEVGAVDQTVGVEADLGGAELDKSNATFGGTIQSVQVSELPLNGRNLTNLELLAPGAIDSGSGAQSTIRFAGNGTDDNNFRLDGVDASGIFHGALKSADRLQFSTEAIAEFKVDSGAYTADTGGSAGGQTSLISKTGTNQFHGSVFDYLRNNYFDAMSPIKSSVARPVFQLNQFGASLGGPIVKDRTFFFANYEGYRQHLGGVPETGYVPSPAFRAQIAQSQPALATVVNAYPQGQAPTSDPNVYSFTGVVPSPQREDAATARVDHHFNAKDSGYVRYNVDIGNSTAPWDALAHAVVVTSSVNNFVIEESHILNANAVNEVEIGLNRNVYMQSETTGLPYTFTLNSGQFTSYPGNFSVGQIGQNMSGTDTFTWTKGAHTFKFGGEYANPWFNEENSVSGTAIYQNENSFLANQLTSFQLVAALPDKGMRKVHMAAYAQDEWKTSRELTLNYGLRYNFFTPFHEVHGNDDPFDIGNCGGYCGMGHSFYLDNYLSFDPRLSVAYAPDAFHGKTVFRAGFGTYHGEDQLGDEDSPAVNTEPSTLLTSSATTVYSYPVAPSLLPTTGLALTPRSMSIHHPDSYVEQWTASIQQALPGQTVLTMTYLGSHGVHVFRRSYTNLINPLTGTRPLPQYPSEIDTKFNEGDSNFNALQIGVTRRFHNGLFFAGNYMWSHALNDGSVGAGDANAPENVACFRCDYASSEYDARQSGTFSAVYDLPFGLGKRYLSSGHLSDLAVGGWSINTVLMARAGMPVNVLLGRSVTDMPDGNSVDQRPNRNPGIPLYNNRGISHWINPQAFSLPAVGTWGNAPANIANGPALWQDDSAVEKTFHVTERNSVIFRTEAFNIFNRAQYGQPGATLGETSTTCAANAVGCTPTETLTVPSSFGKITSTVNSAGLVGTGTPRVLEFSLRVTY
jgi:hypothetical protein